MNTSMNVLSVVSNTNSTNNSVNYKSDTSKNSNAFNDVLSKTTSVRQDAQTSNKNDKSQDLKDSKFEISEETKTALKEAGLSDKDIENIKSPDDLKNVIVEKILNKDSNSKIDSDKLLMLLVSLLKVDTKDLQNLKANTISDIKDAVNSVVKAIGNEGENLTGDKLSQILNSAGDKFKEALDKNLSKVQDPTLKLLLTKEVVSQVEKEVIPQITENLSKTSMPTASQDIVSKLQQELKSALNASLNDVNSQKNVNKDSKINTLDFKETYKEASNDKNLYQTSVSSKEQNQNTDENYSSSNKETSKEDNFLKSLTSDENKEDKISKATNFMTQFNNINKNIKVDDVADVVISKNNMANDVIKTLKYMETNNIKNLTVKIAPKELGEVIIKLTMEGGVMKASIGASNKEAFNLLNSNMSDMTQKLQNNDTKINSLSLNIYNEDTTFFKDGSNQGNNENSKNHKKSKSISGIEEIANEVEDQNEIDSNLNILA
ncbi:flagellar hook-length control protein [Clostridium carboxidivorans P7]|uniref:Flagellar hook-length control protein n=1 Tax=Clostridium carboxidivorans P7 TaxID=536227 RepID=C6PPE8_9CLOT|nr:flagellar hook-length control protein FliK [Clostridium carboxidivorans]AKN33954.1 flagellar hook-length control protein [Clostridium carboxidivorans P7]EET88842.1 flagellar hook-length control protein [Clostridium carboxidivorans P7]EFG88171.1 flagellar hook-length control protein [Clostridium carboxidivorans P7]